MSNGALSLLFCVVRVVVKRSDTLSIAPLNDKARFLVTQEMTSKEVLYRTGEAEYDLLESPEFCIGYKQAMQILALFGPRWYRKSVYLENQALLFDEELSLRGWQRRAWNALLCAEKVLPFWSALRILVGEPDFKGLSEFFELDLVEIINQSKDVVRNGNPYLQTFRFWDMNVDDLTYMLEMRSATSPFIRRAARAYYVVNFALSVVAGDEKNEFLILLHGAGIIEAFLQLFMPLNASRAS